MDFKLFVKMIRDGNFELIKHTIDENIINLTPNEYITAIRIAINYNQEKIMNYFVNYIPIDKCHLIFDDVFMSNDTDHIRYLVLWAINHNIIIPDKIIYRLIDLIDIEIIKKIHEKQSMNTIELSIAEFTIMIKNAGDKVKISKNIQNAADHYELLNFIINQKFVDLTDIDNYHDIINYLLHNYYQMHMHNLIKIDNVNYACKLSHVIFWTIYNNIIIPEDVIYKRIECGDLFLIEEICKYQSFIYRDIHKLQHSRCHSMIKILFHYDVTPKLPIYTYVLSLGNNKKGHLINSFMEHNMFKDKDIKFIRYLRKCLHKGKSSVVLSDILPYLKNASTIERECINVPIEYVLEQIYNEYLYEYNKMSKTMTMAIKTTQLVENTMTLIKYFRDNTNADPNLFKLITSYTPLHKLIDKAPWNITNSIASLGGEFPNRPLWLHPT